MPYFSLMFVRAMNGESGIALDRLLFVARKRIEHELAQEQQTYFPSLSARTLIYKGMLTTPELAQFFPDLIDERMESSMALVHSRFSTNTAARASVSLHCAQRRNQHGARKSKLDAHTRVHVVERSASRIRASIPNLRNGRFRLCVL
jgi:hypothetical protein